MRFRIVSLVLLVMAFSMLGCSGTGAGGSLDEPTLTQEPTMDVIDAAPTTAPTVEATIADATSHTCPVATADTVLYISEANGYCFLYPSTYTLNDQNQVNIDLFLSGKPLESDTSMEPLIAWLSMNTIAKPGAASQVELDEYVIRETSKLGSLESQVTTEQATIGGVPAIIARGPLGRGYARVAYMIANNTLYVLQNEPIDTTVAEIQADSDNAWNIVVGSLTFFAAPVIDIVKPEEVCPQAQATEQVYVSLANGYCFLIWEEWQDDPDLPEIFYGGPEIPSLPDFVLPAKHVSIAVGINGTTDGKTVEQFAQERVEANPTITSIVETGLTFGGYPAVIIADTTADLGQRITLIDVNGTLYSIVIKPTNGDAFPESQPTANDTWNLVTSTIHFFEPWH